VFRYIERGYQIGDSLMRARLILRGQHHYQHLHQTLEVINFYHIIDLECQEETNAPPPESSDNEDDHA